MVRRAAVIALILGSLLAVLNQSDEIFGPAHVQWLPLVLVYLTPFIVVTLSQAVGIQRTKRDRAEQPSMELRPGSFVQTMGSHGIPARAVLLGLMVGLINASIVVTATFIQTGGLNAVPVSPLIQALSLPIVFVLLSQTLAYRQASTLHGWVVRAEQTNRSPTV